MGQTDEGLRETLQEEQTLLQGGFLTVKRDTVGLAPWR